MSTMLGSLEESPGNDFGTLTFFRNRLRRIAMSNIPKKDVNATIDLLEVVVKGHWIACACEIPKWMESLPYHLA